MSSTASGTASGTPSGWASLAEQVRGCRACGELAAVRRHVVVGETPAKPRLVLVGEAPGAQEDAAGRPFVGRAGQLLDQLLEDARLSRAEVAVLNVLKCRPPGNRTPKQSEIGQCRPWLTAQLRLLEPKLVVALGLTAATWFLGRRITLAGARGVPHQVDVDGCSFRLLATYHPSAAVRFGPGGAPLAALRDDLALAARLLVGLEPA